MALVVSVTEVSSWTTSTTPKSIVVPGCVTGDWLFCLAGGDQDPGTVSAAAITTSAGPGTTGAWTEVAKVLTGTQGDWMLLSRAQVTGNGSVTVNIARTVGTGTPGEFGGYVVRAQNSSGIGNFATDFTQGTEQAVSLGVSANNSTVAFLSCDWSASAVASGWTPSAGPTTVERNSSSLITFHAAYWEGQTAGTRNYGSTGSTGSTFRCMAVEILDSGAGVGIAAPSNPLRSMISPALTVRLSNNNVDLHITNKIAGLSYRSVAPGGFAAASFQLQRPIDVNDPMLAPFTKVYIYDGRDGAVLWEGRLSVPGRSASDQGQVWGLGAVGPSAHALDSISPLVYIDRRLEPWKRSVLEGTLMPAGANAGVSNSPITSSLDVVLDQFPSGTPIVNTSRVACLYDVLSGTGMFIGAYGFTWDSGFTSSLWEAQSGMGVNNTHTETPFSAPCNTAGGTFTGWVVTDFAAGRDFATLRFVNQTAGAFTVGEDFRWVSFTNVRLLGRRVDVNGTSVSGSAGMISSFFVHASWVVADLLGRPGMLTQFDGPGAALTALDTVDIDQLAYEDPVTPNQVLDDLMLLEPAAYWAAWESNPTTGKYRFEWSNWPFVAQYEASVVDGFDNPTPTFEMYNQINIRYKDPRGKTRMLTKTQSIPALDDLGLVREGYIDLGDEVGSATNSNAVADTFLSEHASPYSAGTLTIARPIVDIINDREVMPWQIIPGKLIRVRGIEASHQLTGTATWDGITTFRIVSVEVNTEGVATLELDMFTQTQARAMSVVLKKRTRKR